MKIELEKDPDSEHLFFVNTLFSIHFRPYFTSFEKGFITVIHDNNKNICIYNSYISLKNIKSIDELLKLTSAVISKRFNDNKGVFVSIKH